VHDGTVLVPAGVMGVGEVVHAKKAGGSGAPGELILAARSLDLNGRRIMLRSLKLAGVGESRIKDVNTLNTAAAATIPAVSLIGYFVKGGETAVPRGTIAGAKLAADFELPAIPEPKAAINSADSAPENMFNSESKDNEPQ
jgi:hypothetical protein